MAIRPGAIEFTVTPAGPSSRATVFSQPTSPGRIAFESARLSIGSLTELDVIAITRPRPLRSRCGRQSRTSRTADSSSSSTASSTASSETSSGARARRAAAVDHEDVDAAVPLDGCGDEPLQIGRARDVAGDREGAEPRRLALERLGAAREHDDVRTLAGERLGAAEADARGRAADDGRAPGEPEVH